MIKTVYAIPTHRLMEKKNVRDYFTEVEYCIKTLNEECILVFFEDTEEYKSKEVINNVGKEYPKVNYMYINRNDTRKIFDIIFSQLSDNAKKIFKKIYPNENVNYGNIFNRIFIFSILLGAEKIIRRDSDVLIENTPKGKVFPIKNEINLLGKTNNNKIIYICGGGYKEKYDLDIDSLIRNNGKDYSLVRELFSCMSIPEEHHDDIINEEILNNNIPFEKDNIDYDSKAYPECGNVGIFKLHEYFPSSCQDFILGSDYFFIDVAIHTKLNVVYHNRAVIHRHTKDRKSEYQKVYNYWKGFLMLIDSQIFYRNFYEKYLDNEDFNNYEYIHDNIKKITKNMELELNKYFKDDVYYRQQKMNECLKVLKKSDDNNIKEISEKLKDEFDFILNYTQKSIEEHIELIKNWKEICDVTRLISTTKEIEMFIDKKIINGG